VHSPKNNIINYYIFSDRRTFQSTEIRQAGFWLQSEAVEKAINGLIDELTYPNKSIL
jgi:hypothetical protein